MSEYGRHIEILQGPLPQHRLGRYISNPDDQILQWMPVKVVGDPDDDGRQVLELCTGPTHPVLTKHGLAVCETLYEQTQFDRNPALTRPSDYDMIPVDTAVQLVHGPEVRLKTFNSKPEWQTVRTYTSKIIVAGLGATPTVTAGNFLTPGVGNAVDGYWAETADENLAWAVVTFADADLGICEFELKF